MYVNDKRVYYYNLSEDVFEEILPENILDVKIEKQSTISDDKINSSKLELLLVTPKKVYSVNTFGDYINRDKNKLEILAGLIKSNMK